MLVMRHSGLCVKRQYAAFAGIANGSEKCNAFFAKLVRRGFAIATGCIHNRAHLYHVHSKPLYYAIGEPDSRYRRTVPVRVADERLMRLDAALISRDLEWLTTRSEKLACLTARTAADSATVANDLPGTFPIGIDPSGRTVLLYLATKPWTDDFRTFLVGHTGLLNVTPIWPLRLVFPQPLRRAVAAYQTVADEELQSPFHADTIRELQHYFFHRRRGTDLTTIPENLRAIITRYANVYGGPRFTHLYRRWLTDETAALRPVSPAIQEAFATGRAAVECMILPHAYDHLSPLVDRQRSRHRHNTAEATEGDETPHGINPSLNPNAIRKFADVRFLLYFSHVIGTYPGD
ncbi:MAG: hypothetical protein HY047_08540, partial [Acidobacteria bacterium]|nr:hypothetical protein [Acidobacteriota bacterium]